jgi:hypothetical protein
MVLKGTGFSPSNHKETSHLLFTHLAKGEMGEQKQ